jgi:hypothetical protein
MHKFLSTTILATMALLVAGCGGSSNTPFVPPGSGGGTGSSPPSTVAVTSDATTIPADSSASANITALVKDAKNNAVSGATVTFSSSAGSLVVGQATTDATGVAKAALSASGAAAGTSITVTAGTGGIAGTVVIGVVSTQQTVTVTTSLPQIPSDNSKSATITALVRDANNNALSGVTVKFTATSGGLTVVSGTTDVNGSATATLDAAGDPTDRTITVTATAGSAQSTVPVDVTGTTLTVTGSNTLVLGSQGTYSVSLIDSGKNGISGKVVTLASSNGNTLSAPTVTTNATGHATFTVTAAKAGADTITASALGQAALQSLAVSGQSFAFTSPAADTKVPISTVQALSVTWTNGGAPVVGQTVTFASTRGTFVGGINTAVTNGAGVATVSISSAAAGPALVNATATGVTAQLSLDFIATVPSTITLQASPSTVPTQGQSTLTAVVRDPQQNLVEGATVNFGLTDTTGGSLSAAAGTTDNQGRAQVIYTAGGTPSATNGVVVTASIPAAALSQSTTVTVGGQSVFLTLGTGNTVGENSPTAPTLFLLPYVVQAVDAAGNGVGGVTISLKVHSTRYQKGVWVVVSGAWVQVFSTAGNVPCNNEDVNGNGILDAGEDFNTNGKLDPGDISAVSPGSVVTDSTGSAALTITYPEDHAQWVEVILTATATATGTESSTSATFALPIAAKYVTNTQASPPGQISPYGTHTCNLPN